MNSPLLGARSPVCQSTARRRESYALCAKKTRFAARASVQLRNSHLARLTMRRSRHTILLEFLGEGKRMGKDIDLLRGTLDMLILKAVSLGPQHGYGVLLRIQQLANGNLQIEQGSLYPALYRLEHKGFIESEWGESENNRKAKFYRLTSAGRRQLRLETESWKRLGETITAVLSAVPEEL